MYWMAALAVLLVTIGTATYSGLASTAVFFFLGLLLGKPKRLPPPNPFAAVEATKPVLGVVPSWDDPKHPAYEPNPAVRAIIDTGIPVAKAREMVRTAGGDPDKKPHVVGPKAVATPIVPAVPAPGTTRTVRFDFDDADTLVIEWAAR